MAELEAVAAAAIEAAGLGDGTTEEVVEAPVESTEEHTEEVVEPEGGGGEEKVVEAKVEKKEEKPDEDAELAKELEEFGLKAPAPGKDNRIPYSRTIKIIANALKKRGVSFEAAKTELTKQIEALSTRTKLMDELETFVAAKPDDYIKHLAKTHPDLYGKYLNPVTGKVNEPVNPDADDKKPEPDGKFADGSTGYTPEGLEKLGQWWIRQGEKAALAKFNATLDERFKPVSGLLKQKEVEQTLEARRAAIKTATEEARAQWGDVFTQDEAKGNDSEIVKELVADSQRVAELNKPLIAFNRTVPQAQWKPLYKPTPFSQVVTKVLLPKVVAARAKQREEIIAELNAETGEKKAASTKTRGGMKEVKSDEPRELESVVAEAIAKAGITI